MDYSRGIWVKDNLDILDDVGSGAITQHMDEYMMDKRG